MKAFQSLVPPTTNGKDEFSMERIAGDNLDVPHSIDEKFEFTNEQLSSMLSHMGLENFSPLVDDAVDPAAQEREELEESSSPQRTNELTGPQVAELVKKSKASKSDSAHIMKMLRDAQRTLESERQSSPHHDAHKEPMGSGASRNRRDQRRRRNATLPQHHRRGIHTTPWARLGDVDDDEEEFDLDAFLNSDGIMQDARGAVMDDEHIVSPNHDGGSPSARKIAREALEESSAIAMAPLREKLQAHMDLYERGAARTEEWLNQRIHHHPQYKREKLRDTIGRAGEATQGLNPSQVNQLLEETSMEDEFSNAEDFSLGSSASTNERPIALRQPLGGRPRKARGYLFPTRPMQVEIPVRLNHRIHELTRHKGFHIQQHANKLSTALRQRTRVRPGESTAQRDHRATASQHHDQLNPIGYDVPQALAYCVHRLPAVYACTSRVLQEIRWRRPEWSPQSVIDLGSGPGTMVWSTKEVWPEIQSFVGIEPSEGMRYCAERLLRGLKHVRYMRYLPKVATEKHDLSVASYVLSELPSSERLDHVRQLWDHTQEGGLMVLVEPGTPLGFEILLNVRESLLKGAHAAAKVVAPCPHHHACPMPADSWCHFSQRLQRIPVQVRSKKDASKNWEDEKFSYLVLEKEHREPQQQKQHLQADETWDRIVHQPQKKGRHVIFSVCSRSSGNMETHIVAKGTHGKHMYRDARKSAWGDGFHFSQSPRATKRNIPAKKRKHAFRQSQIEV